MYNILQQNVFYYNKTAEKIRQYGKNRQSVANSSGVGYPLV